MKFTYRTKGTCSSAISFDLTDGIVSEVEFTGGCSGNLKAIAKLIDGWQAEKVIEKCLGNTCGYKTTSCADQLARALREALDKTTA